MEKKPVFTFESEDYLDPTFMIPYNLRCDDRSFVGYEVDGEQYIYMDSYCINPECDCMNVLFDVVKKSDLKEAFTAFHYDYGLGKITAELMPVPQFVVDEIKSDTELKDILYERSRLIRQAFFQSSLERKIKKAQQALLPKVGRNDPCTCGSGKKFKKCCGA
jgi:SEC-C motif